MITDTHTKKKYLIPDTESNGPGVNADVLQMAWQAVDPRFRTVRADGGYLAPIDRLNPKAAVITGFERKTLLKQAEDPNHLYKRLLRDLRGCKAIIGHSVDLDIERMTNDARRRCSPEVAERVANALKAMPYYDTAAHTIKFVNKHIERTFWLYHRFPVYQTRLATPSLGLLARKLKVDFTGIRCHSADGDVELTRRCMVAMRESHRELVRDLISNKIVNPSTSYAWIQMF